MLALLFMAAGLAASTAVAGDGCCAHCGCESHCQKICRLVCEEKKVETTSWGCQCEDFCVPSPSHLACKHCEPACESCADACDPDAVCAKPKKFVWKEWIPTCAKIYTKKKLMKKVETHKVPSWKWVVEDLCPACEAGCPHAEVPPGTPIPPPPLTNAKLRP